MGVLKARVGGQWVDVAGGGSPIAHGFTPMPAINVPPGVTVWGGNTTVPIPIGAANVILTAAVAGVVRNFTDGSNIPMDVSLEMSSDGGANWQVQPTQQTVPFGQVGNPIINRAPLNTSYSWTIPVVTVAPLLRVKLNDPGHTANTSNIYPGAMLEWWFAGASIPVLAQPVSPSQPLGIVAVGGMIAGTTNPFVVPTGVTSALSANTPVYLAVGRRYRVNFTIRAAATGTAASMRMHLRDGATGINVPDRWLWLSVANYTSHSHEWIIEGDGTTKQLNVAVDNVNQSGMQVWVDNAKEFYVEDIGPNQSPPLPIPDTPTPWIPLPLNSNWVPYYGGWSIPGYRKIGDMVQVRGLVVGQAGANLLIATLPVGYRPAYGEIYASWMSWPAVGRQPCRVDIQADGTIQVRETPSNVAAITYPIDFLTLGQPSFSVTA